MLAPELVPPEDWGEVRGEHEGLICSAVSGEGLQGLLEAVEQRIFRERARAETEARAARGEPPLEEPDAQEPLAWDAWGEPIFDEPEDSDASDSQAGLT